MLPCSYRIRVRGDGSCWLFSILIFTFRSNKNLMVHSRVRWYGTYVVCSLWGFPRSGIEPILHDDISTHMCSCVGGTLSGLIVIMVGSVLQRQRRHGAPNDKEMVISDHEVVVLMIVSYVLSYTLLFTILEPLRAAIKATYVSFAQHPESLSRSFPIVYHRLQRLASNPVNS